MSLYDGISVETAPLSAVIGSSNSSNESKADNSNISGWSSSTSGMKMMATQVRRAKKAASKPTPHRSRSNPTPNVVLGGSQRSSQFQSPGPSVTSSAPSRSIPEEPMEDDIGVTLEDEYDPFVPNDYEALTKSRKEKEGEKKLEERKRSSSERKTLSAFSSYSDSDSEEDEQWKEEKRRESAAMFAPPPTLVESSQPSDDNKDEMAPFAVPRPPKFASAVASNIMAKYGWKAGQGLGKTEQGLKTALSVEKTSLRGGKIVNKGRTWDQLCWSHWPYCIVYY